VTVDELKELLADCPTLYHMAQVGSWTSVETLGLLSTSALLDAYGVHGIKRTEIESQRRSSSIALGAPGRTRAVVRDQLPMDDKGLRRCLQDGLTPEAWYRLLNSKVFFWLTRDRLVRLLNAGAYRNQEHDVLELDSRALVQSYEKHIWFCPINSGCTKPFPTPRGNSTFQRIADYPYSDWRRRRRRGERVVELAVDYSVADVKDYVRRVTRMKGDGEVATIFEQ
jgi:hypothetical protein